jgi:hypothetical protein
MKEDRAADFLEKTVRETAASGKTISIPQNVRPKNFAGAKK